MPPRKSLPVEKAATVAPTTQDFSPLPQAAQPARATSVPEGADTIEKGHGGHPHTSKNTSGINIEDLNLPKSIVTRLAKENLPNGTAIQATALLGIQKSATVFINYLANQANEYAQSASRKTVSPADVLRAIEEVGFGEWRGTLEMELRTFEQNAKAKRDKGNKGGEDGEAEGGRPRKKLKGHKGEEDVQEEIQLEEEVEEAELGDEEGDEQDDGAEAEADVEGEGDEEEEEEEEDDDGKDEDEDDEDEQLRVRGKSEDEALDNGDDSD